MEVTQQLIKNLARARLSAYPNFEKIELDPAAMVILTRLFLNPDCISDIDLGKLTTQATVKLCDLAKHIVTAAPVTIAQYCEQHNKLLVTEKDMILCFGLDHIDSVFRNKVHESDNPQVALAHILTAGKVKSIKKNLVTMIVQLGEEKSVELKNVLIPRELTIKKGQTVWQHYGVVIEKAEGDLAEQVRFGQKEIGYFQKILGQNNKKVIDFSDRSIFQKDLIGAILSEERALKAKKSFNAKKKLVTNIDKDIKFAQDA
ncbi:MAG: hypothetical protein ABIB97_03235 [Patescibacteria group bacterium]